MTALRLIPVFVSVRQNFSVYITVKDFENRLRWPLLMAEKRCSSPTTFFRIYTVLLCLKNQASFFFEGEGQTLNWYAKAQGVV